MVTVVGASAFCREREREEEVWRFFLGEEFGTRLEGVPVKKSIAGFDTSASRHLLNAC